MSNAPVPSSQNELQIQQSKQQYEIACKQIDFALQNNREVREHIQSLTKHTSWLNFVALLVAMVLFFGFGAYAMYLGKETLLSDLLKVIMGALGGGGLGFYFGFRQRQQQQPPQQ